MAYIKKLPSGNYQAQIRLKGLKPITKTFKTKNNAIIFARKIEGDAELALSLGNPNYHNIVLSQLIKDFKDQYNKKDPNILRRLDWWDSQYGNVQLSVFSENHILEGIDILLEKGTRGKPVAGQTTNRFKAALSTCINYGIDRRGKFGITTNPCRQVKGQPEGKGRKRVFTTDEKNKFIDASKYSDWNKFYLFVLMGFICGARRGELFELTWKDIDFTKKQAFCSDTKNSDDKILHLTDVVIAELQKFREVGNGIIFLKDGNNFPDYRNEWDDAMDLAEIDKYDVRYGEKLVFHSERHTFCTDLHSAGVDIHTIKTLAGHKTIVTTQRYTKDDEKLKAKTVNDVFGSLGS